MKLPQGTRTEHRVRLCLAPLEGRIVPAGPILQPKVGYAEMVQDLNTGKDDSAPRELTNINGRLFFFADHTVLNKDGNPVLKTALWVSDGTNNAVTWLADFNFDPALNAHSPVSMGGKLYFVAPALNGADELWMSDGTPGGTKTVKAINANSPQTNPANLFVAGNKIYFNAFQQGWGQELWESNGTDAGTKFILDLNPTMVNQTPVSSTPVPRAYDGQQYLYVSANGVDQNNQPVGNELFQVDVSAVPSYKLVGDINVGAGDSAPNNVVVFNQKVDFVANDGTGRKLFEFDEQQTPSLYPIQNAGGAPDSLVVSVSTLFYKASTADGLRLFAYSGNALPRVVLDNQGKEVSTGDGPIVATPNGVVFTGPNPNSGLEAWVSDGTQPGTGPIANMPDSNPGGFLYRSTRDEGEGLFFVGFDPQSNALRLYKSNGKVGGGAAIVPSTPQVINPDNLTLSGSNLFFSGSDGDHGNELWVYRPPTPRVLNGSGFGDVATVRVSDPDGADVYDIQPYGPYFTGGVRVARGDVNGDGFDDIITAPGPGTQNYIDVYSGLDGTLLNSFLVGDPDQFDGAYVAAGDVNGDGHADIVVGAGDMTGSSHVWVYSGADYSLLRDFDAFSQPSYSGGARVAVGDVNGDGYGDVIVGSGPGSDSLVAAFSGSDGSLLESFTVAGANASDGLFVAAGDFDGDGTAEIVVGSNMVNGGSTVQLYSGGGSLLSTQALAGFSGSPSLAVEDLDGDGVSDLLAGDAGEPQVAWLSYADNGFTEHSTFDPFDPSYTGGIYVG